MILTIFLPRFYALFQPFLAQKSHRYWALALALCISLPGFAAHEHGYEQGRELSGQALIDRIKQGRVALLMRHAQTVPGIGDPPGFKLSDCSTQRNLSEEGKAQSARIGAALREAGIQPTAVRTSAWCRCKDTAKGAFDDFTVWAQLNSFFDARENEPLQTAALVRALQMLKPGQTEVWITHQVNVTALTRVAPAVGEIVVVRFGTQRVEVLGRMRL